MRTVYAPILIITALLLGMLSACDDTKSTAGQRGGAIDHEQTSGKAKHRERLDIGLGDERGPEIPPADLQLMKKLRFDMLRSQLLALELNDTQITEDNVDSLAREEHFSIHDGRITYAPLKQFKIFTFEEEHCGATCFLNWISYVYFKAGNKEVIKELETMMVDSIYQLPDHKYLLLESGSVRPISAYYAECRAAKVISFVKDSIVVHPIRYRGGNELYLRHDNDQQPDIKPYIKYDPQQQVMTYRYISNRSYLSGGPNIDSLRTGIFNYVNGKFVLRKKVTRATIHRQIKDRSISVNP